MSKETEKPTTGIEKGRVCTRISGNSLVLNGDAKRSPQTDTTRTHIMNGGTVTNESLLVNGATDFDTLMLILSRSR